ncbi:MAG: MFS transporter [Clostridia bacterium]|nr:MFS transporter [Clostridia bacterium]MBQ7380357.1 MFS transporter [Clostridia bacterium]
MSPNYKRTKLACYSAYFTMSSIFILPPLLFATLQDTYGISYTLLGTLVLTNFCTQMIVDLLFSLFAKKFNAGLLVRVTPLITSLGLVIYALVPTFLPQFAYVGLLVGTIVFSIASGLSEVMLSPTIAALPSDNPQRDMSMLHSLYAFGILFVIVLSTVFFALFGAQNWMYLTLFFAALPIIAAVMFFLSPMPDLQKGAEQERTKRTGKRTLGLALCVACIFFGSCAENTMSNWISGYMENALHIDKAVGDLVGMAAFAVLLGLTRITYAKFGKNIFRMLIVGMIGAAVCYLVVAFSGHPIPALVACVLTGIFTSMLWPGALIMMEENVTGVGVAAYALMASGGDLGASVAPQLMGIVTDAVSQSELGIRLAAQQGLSPEQIGLKAGMLVCSLFPILGIAVLLCTVRFFKKCKKNGEVL